MRLTFLLFVFTLFIRVSFAYSNGPAIIIFSKDRAIQLYACLESINNYVTNIHSITVIYKTSDSQHEQAYMLVQKAFPSCIFVNQYSKADFKPLVIREFSQGDSNYIMFAVDDIIVTTAIDCAFCIELLEKTKAYGFYMRLGKNITYCYSQQREIRLPELLPVFDDVYTWQFKKSQGDWAWQTSLDMTLYRKADLENYIKNLLYTSPNTLEAQWSKYRDFERFGLCWEKARIVNLPLNRVQTEYNNRVSNLISYQELLVKFLEGFKIDITSVAYASHNACHSAYRPLFVRR